MLRVIVNLCLIKMLHNSIMPKRRMKRRGGQIPSQPMNNASPSVAPKPPPNPVAVTNAYPAKPIENSMNVGGISDNQSTTSSFKSFIENYGEYIILVIIILIVGLILYEFVFKSMIFSDDKKDEDGFLYVNYTNENTFG